MNIPIDLLVTVICEDGNCQVPLADLLSITYFNKMLSRFNTKMSFSKNTITKNGMIYTKYEYEIPHLKVDLTIEMFKFLVSINGKIHRIYSFGDVESILEIMMNIDFYQIICNIEFGGGFSAEKEFFCIEYIKKKLPHLNAFDIIKNGKFGWYSFFVERAFLMASEDQLSIELSLDLIKYLEIYLDCKWNVNDYDFTIDRIIKSVKYLHKYCKNDIEKIVTTNKIKNMIQNYTNISKSYIGNAETWGWYDCRKDYEKFNSTMTIIFDELVILNNLGLIDPKEIGNKESYILK